MKNRGMVSLVLAIAIIIVGVVIAKGNWPSSITLTEAGVRLAMGEYVLRHTVPGIALIFSGTVIAIPSIIQLQK